MSTTRQQRRRRPSGFVSAHPTTTMQIVTVGCEFVRCFVTGEVSVRCVFCVCRVYYYLRVVYNNNVLCPNICICSNILKFKLSCVYTFRLSDGCDRFRFRRNVNFLLLKNVVLLIYSRFVLDTDQLNMVHSSLPFNTRSPLWSKYTEISSIVIFFSLQCSLNSCTPP